MPRTTRSMKKNPAPPAKRRLLFTDEEDTNYGGGGRRPVVVAHVTPVKKKKKETTHRHATESRATYFSPTKATPSASTSALVVVTPDKTAATKHHPHKKQKQTRHDEPEEPPKQVLHVPYAIHKKVQYQQRGCATLSDTTVDVFQFVTAHYTIPSDLERNILQYGPLSGTCYEVRVLEAYERNLLVPKLSDNNTNGTTSICTNCGTLDHVIDNCPQLL